MSTRNVKQQQMRVQRLHEAPLWPTRPRTAAGGSGSIRRPPKVAPPGDRPNDDPWWLAWLLYAEAVMDGLSGGTPVYDAEPVLGRPEQVEGPDDGALNRWATDGGA